jgi:hypothetical protein
LALLKYHNEADVKNLPTAGLQTVSPQGENFFVFKLELFERSDINVYKYTTKKATTQHHKPLTEHREIPHITIRTEIIHIQNAPL